MFIAHSGERFFVFHRRNPLRNEWYSEYILAPVMTFTYPACTQRLTFFVITLRTASAVRLPAHYSRGEPLEHPLVGLRPPKSVHSISLYPSDWDRRFALVRSSPTQSLFQTRECSSWCLPGQIMGSRHENAPTGVCSGGLWLVQRPACRGGGEYL